MLAGAGLDLARRRMRLDFATLVQAAENAWRHWGHWGHQQRRGFRCPHVPSPRWGHPGTSGDKRGTWRHRCVICSCKERRFVPICPHLSPGGKRRKVQCWRGVPNVPSVPIENAQVSPGPCERADLAGDPTGAGVNTCANLQRLLPRGTCDGSQSTGLLAHAQDLGILWLARRQGEA